MSDATDEPTAKAPPPKEVPFMQRLLDNHFLLLVLGLAVPTLLYLVWGVMEVISIPLAP